MDSAAIFEQLQEMTRRHPGRLGDFTKDPAQRQPRKV
jgi:hypothetical protein